jgi:arylsulfatase A-like enzyme
MEKRARAERWDKVSVNLRNTKPCDNTMSNKKEKTNSVGIKRPNIIYIFTDQQFAGAMSCAGNLYLKTPSMDNLAASGVRFENAYCTAPLCAPSRASMITGLLPHETGMVRNKSVGIHEYLRRQEMGWLFKDAGYECVYGGKWHLPTSPYIDPGHGFENISPLDDIELTKACVKFLHRKHDKPFLLVASYNNPHKICGWKVPGEKLLKMGLQFYWRLSKKNNAALEELIAQCPTLPANFDIPKLEPEVLNKSRYAWFDFFEKWPEECWRICRWAYYRYVELIDIEIGCIVQAVKESGLEKNTLVIFSSDHGEGHGAHHWLTKRNFYEESVRVPFIFSYKGVAQVGKVDYHLTSNGLDLIPTMCDYASIKRPKGLYGRTLRPLIEGRAVDSWHEDITAQGCNPKITRMIRTDRYKYIVYQEGKHREQLFDIEKDPGEMIDLAENADCRHILKDHHNRLLSWCKKTKDKNGEEICSNLSRFTT